MVFLKPKIKKKTGELFKRLKEEDDGAWVCGGDLNLMLWSMEKQGGGDFRYEEAEWLWEALDFCGLEDLHYVGHPFTWTNNQGGEANLQERLDRFVANASWKDLFGSSSVTHLEKRKSDHLPIVLNIRTHMQRGTKAKKKKLFRFEEMWTKEEECGEVIAAEWIKGDDVNGNLSRTASKLREWSHKRFGEFAKEMRACKQQMGELMEAEQTTETLQKMRDIDSRMDELESREEIFWKQRSRQDWLCHGDRNTQFFHSKAKQRERRNNISRLKDAAGAIHEDEESIAEVLVNHFQEMFCANSETDMDPIIGKVQRSISEEMCRMLAAPFRREEILDALKQMHPMKAPGPDGMCALFYQKFWNTIGDDMTDIVMKMLNEGGNIGTLNQTFIALIPKKKKECESPIHFRPISLCNVSYKIIAKVLTNRIKSVLPSIIHESQSGFVPGRLITDNIIFLLHMSAFII